MNGPTTLRDRSLRPVGPRVLHVALAEGRGHLMRAHRLRALLANDVSAYDIATTNDAGRRFLEVLGTPSFVLPGRFALPYDGRHVLNRSALGREIARYVGTGAIVRDRLAIDAHGADLVIVDSFHPAMLVLPLRRVVFVHGDTMEAALLAELDREAPPLAWMVRRALAGATACIHHSFAPGAPRADRIVLPPLLDPVRGLRGKPRRPLACVYLNPHHRDEAIACALEQALAPAFDLHLVGEGFAHRPGWVGVDADLHESIAHASLFVSGGGMASIAEALRFGTPLLALEGDQPEQRRNLDRVSLVLGTSLARVSITTTDDLAARIRAALADRPLVWPREIARDRSALAWRRTLLDAIALPSPFPNLTPSPGAVG